MQTGPGYDAFDILDDPANGTVGGSYLFYAAAIDACSGLYGDVAASDWSSSDTAVGTIDYSGNMSFVGAGTTTVRASSRLSSVNNCCCRPQTFFASATTNVCGVPTGFRQVVGEPRGGGVVHFEYVWGSSTGRNPDLGTSGCTVFEYVTYPGPDPYYWPNPPWVQSNQNPGISPNPGIPGQNGSLPDDHLPGTFGSSKAEATFTATQYYRYSCTCNNSSNVNLAGPISITRSVSQNPNGTWKYTITKSGVSASINPLP